MGDRVSTTKSIFGVLSEASIKLNRESHYGEGLFQEQIIVSASDSELIVSGRARYKADDPSLIWWEMHPLTQWAEKLEIWSLVVAQFILFIKTCVGESFLLCLRHLSGHCWKQNSGFDGSIIWSSRALLQMGQLRCKMWEAPGRSEGKCYGHPFLADACLSCAVLLPVRLEVKPQYLRRILHRYESTEHTRVPQYWSLCAQAAAAKAIHNV